MYYVPVVVECSSKKSDRSKSGTKHSLLVDGKGIPLGMMVDRANRHDIKMTK